MSVTFRDLNLNTPLYNAIEDLGLVTPTPIQEESFNVIGSGSASSYTSASSIVQC